MKFSISHTKLASLIVLAILLIISIFIVYQFLFTSMQESFVTLSTYGNFKIEDENDFKNYSDMIQHNIDLHFPGLTIDNSLNTSLYFKRVNNEDLYFYSENNKYDWDNETIQLYRKFLNSQNIDVSDEDFNSYVEKLRNLYNQNMILEIMSYETNRHKFLTSGVVVDGSHNILQPWDSSTMSLTGSQYIIKCDGNLKKYTSPSSVGTDFSLNTINGLYFPDGECNPCDSLLAPDNIDRYKCKYNINMKNDINLCANGIWNKIWNIFTNMY